MSGRNLGQLTIELQAKTQQLQQEFGSARKTVAEFEKATRLAAKVNALFEAEAKKAEKAVAAQAKAIAQAAKEQARLARETAKAAKEQERQSAAAARTNSMKTKFTELASAATLARGALNLVKEGFELAENAARSNTAAAFFANSGKSIDDFRKATKGLVSDADLIKKANLADTMGITGEQFKQLANVAQASAAKTGQSYSYMLDSIIIGTARESRLLLDNLGIIIDVTAAREEYVEELRKGGKLGEYASKTNKELAASLTDAEEKAAFLAKAMTVGQPILDEYAKAGATGAENFDKFAASSDNLAKSIGTTLNNVLMTVLPDLIKQLDEFNTKLNNAQRRKDGWGEAGAYAEGLAPGAGALLGGMIGGPAGAAVGYAVGKGASEFVGSGFAETEGQWNTHAADAVDALAAQLEKDTGGQIDVVDALSATRAQIAEWDLEYEGNTKALIEAIQAWDKQLGGVYDAKAVAKAKEDAKGKKRFTFDENDKKNKKEKKENYTDGVGSDAWLADKTSSLIDKAGGDLFKRMKEEADDAAKAAIDREIEQREEEIAARKRLNEQLDGLLPAIMDAGGSAAATGSVSGAVSGLAGAIGAAAGMPGTGDAIGSFLGPLMEKIPGLVKYMDLLSGGFELLIVGGLSPLMGALEPFAEALSRNLAVIGKLIAAVLRPLEPVLDFVVSALTTWVSVITSGIIVMLTFWEAFSVLITATLQLGQVFWSLVEVIAHLFGANLPSFADTMWNLSHSVDTVSTQMVQGAIDINNGIVRAFNAMGKWLDDTTGSDFGLSGFGEILEMEDLLIQSVDENSSSTDENTEAVRELTREFRNLPSGYKVNRAIYGADAMDGAGRGSSSGRGGGSAGGGGSSALDQYRNTLGGYKPFGARDGWRDRT